MRHDDEARQFRRPGLLHKPGHRRCSLAGAHHHGAALGRSRQGPGQHALRGHLAQGVPEGLDQERLGPHIGASRVRTCHVPAFHVRASNTTAHLLKPTSPGT